MKKDVIVEINKIKCNITLICLRVKLGKRISGEPICPWKENVYHDHDKRMVHIV